MTPQEKEDQKEYFKNQAQFLVSTDAGGRRHKPTILSRYD